MQSIFATTSGIGEGHGGGIVSYNIALALSEATHLKLILCNGDTDLAPYKNINPAKYGLQPNPFLYDYIAAQYVEPVDIAHFRGDPFGLTAEKIKLMNPKAKIIVDVPAHSIEESKKEFEIWGCKYPFLHMVDNVLWKFYSKHIRIADVIVAPSTYSANYMKTSEKFTRIFLHEPNIKIIPHGVNLPEHVTEFPDRFRVCHLGAAGFDKGQIYLLLAWKKLKLEDASLVIAGYGTENWDEFIRRNEIQNAFASGKIENAHDIYDICSVYVQPSVCEGFGIPVLEAMSHGRPVIVTEGTGAKDLVEDGQNGFIVPIRDPDAIAEKIQYFYDNPDEIKRMGKNARKTAEKYDWSYIREEYKKLLCFVYGG